MANKYAEALQKQNAVALATQPKKPLLSFGTEGLVSNPITSTTTSTPATVLETPQKLPIQATPDVEKPTQSKYAVALAQQKNPTTSRYKRSSTSKYAVALAEQNKNPYFGTTTPQGDVIGFSTTEKDPSGKPYLAYRNPGDTSTTTDYTRIATKFDPRTPQKVTRDAFYNPRFVENKAALKEAMGGAYSDELDHKIAVALAGSNNPKNLRPIPASKNDDSAIISSLQQKVITGEMSLFDAQVSLAKQKGIDIPWTPREARDAKRSVFGDFLGKVSSTWKNSIAPAIEKATTAPEYKPGDSVLRDTFKLIPSTLVETLAPGVRAIRQEPETAAKVTAKDIAKNLPKAAVQTVGRMGAEMYVAPALTVFGAIRGAATNDPSKANVSIYIPGIGDVNSKQLNAVTRIERGENPYLVAAEEGIYSVFDTLMVYGAVRAAFSPRQVTVYKENVKATPKVNQSVLPETAGGQKVFDVGPKSFRSYTKPVATKFIPQDAVEQMKIEGINFNNKFDPTRPTFIRYTGIGKGNLVRGEVVQLKPSLANSLFNKISKSPNTNKAYFETAIKNSQAEDIDRAIKVGEVPKEAVYKQGKVLTPEFAQGRVDDIAMKLDMYQPGLGQQFRGSVDINNSTMNGLVDTGEMILNNAGIFKALPSPNIVNNVIAAKALTLPETSFNVQHKEEVDIDGIVPSKQPTVAPQDSSTPVVVKTPEQIVNEATIPKSDISISKTPFTQSEMDAWNNNTYNPIDYNVEYSKIVSKLDSQISSQFKGNVPVEVESIKNEFAKKTVDFLREKGKQMVNAPSPFVTGRAGYNFSKAGKSIGLYERKLNEFTDFIDKTEAKIRRIAKTVEQERKNNLSEVERLQEEIAKYERQRNNLNQYRDDFLVERINKKIASLEKKVLKLLPEQATPKTVKPTQNKYASAVPKNKEIAEINKKINDLKYEMEDVEPVNIPLLRAKLEKLEIQKKELQKAEKQSKVIESVSKGVKVEKPTETREKLVNSLKAEYLKLGMGDYEVPKADEALGQVLLELELAEKGQRIATVSDEPGINFTWTAKRSTFPKWIPDNSRSRTAIDEIMQYVDSIEAIKFPTNNLSVAKARFIDAILNQVDAYADIDTSAIRSDIMKTYEKQTKDETGGEEKDSKSVSIGGPRNNKGEINPEEIAFKGVKAPTLTLKTLEKLGNRTTVNKQFISDLTNTGDIKQVERDLIRQVLETTPNGPVNIQEFKQKVQSELLPLNVVNIRLSKAKAKKQLENIGVFFEEDMAGEVIMVDKNDNALEYDELPTYTQGLVNTYLSGAETYGQLKNQNKYEFVNLPYELRGNVLNYKENIYESPIKTSAGDVHFVGTTDSYFGHTRVEDMADGTTRRIIEVQSDLYQKGNLEREKGIPKTVIYQDKEYLYRDSSRGYVRLGNLEDAGKPLSSVPMVKEIKESEAVFKYDESKLKEKAKLYQYNDPTAHFRMVREEITKAAIDEKKTLLFPTGETAMKIEGLGETSNFFSASNKPGMEGMFDVKLKPENLNVGEEVFGNGDKWVITEILGDGKFKASKKLNVQQRHDKYVVFIDGEPQTVHTTRKEAEDWIQNAYKSNSFTETFDISGKVDTNNPIYRFYEKDLGKYLTNKYKAEIFTDNKGVSWYKVDIKPEMADIVEAFKGALDRREERMRAEQGLDIGTIEEGKKIFESVFNEREVNFLIKDKPEVLEDGTVIYGKFRTVRGQPFELPKYFIEIAQIKPGMVSLATIRHEAVHAYLKIGRTDEQRARIIRRAMRLAPIYKQGQYGEMSIYNTPEKRAEEFLADDFQDYINAKYGKGKPYKGFFADLWERAIEYIKDLFRRYTGAKQLYEEMLNRKKPQREVSNLQKKVGKQGGYIKIPGMGERIAKATEEGARKMREVADKAAKQRAQREEAGKELPIEENLIETMKASLDPLRGVDPTTREIFRQWNKNRIAGRERARAVAFDYRELPRGMDFIHDYQAGKRNEFTDAVKQAFDSFRDEFNQRGMDIDYVENYVPQQYANSAAEFQQAALMKLEGLGLTKAEALDYINQNRRLPTEKARRLKLTPTFERERFFESYKEAEQYGLIPKYKNIGDLITYYVAEGEKAIANRNLVTKLEDAGKILGEGQAPLTWSKLNPQFVMTENYRAPGPLARIINNLFVDTNIGSFSSKLFSKTAWVSQKLQEITLSAGVPRTNFNFFSTGQLIKEITAGNLGAIKPYIRANSDVYSLRYFQEKENIIKMMGNQGIDLTGRIGGWDESTFKELVASKQWFRAVGTGFDKLFNEKTFRSFLPMMHIDLFEKVYLGAKNKGYSETEAQNLAGKVVKNNFGLFTDSFARSQFVNDVLSTFFFAPRFRESIIRVITNTMKAGYDFGKNGFKRGNPAYSRNLRLLGGIIATVIIYQMANKAINDNYTWENPDGREFALRIPLDNGQVIYIEMMPGFLAFPRMIGTGSLALARGDFQTAIQKFGGLLSTPMKLITDVLGNEDYFGREIYPRGATGVEKAKLIGEYLFLNANHPFVKEIVKYTNTLEEDRSLLQTIAIMMELPLKYSTLDKEARAEMYKKIDQQNKEVAEAKAKFMPTYEKIKKLETTDKTEATRLKRDLSDKDWEIYKSIERAEKKDITNKNKPKGYRIWEEIRDLKLAGDLAEAQLILKSLTDEEYKAYESIKKQMEK